MVYKIVVSPEAFRELELAECYFKTKNLEKDFLEDFNTQILFLENMPFARQIRYKQVRIHLFKKYMYSIHYLVVDLEVRILHILNQKQGF